MAAGSTPSVYYFSFIKFVFEFYSILVMWGTGADGGSLLKCNFEKFSFRFVFQFPNFRWIESHPILSKDEANEDVSIAQWRKVKQMQSMHYSVILHLLVQAI